MAYTDYEYDRYANEPANLITSEVHLVNVDVDRSVFLEHGAFYNEDFDLVVEGRFGSDPWENLQPEVDFQYSPLFLQAAAKTGKQVFSYLIFMKKVSEVRVQYRALGKYQDDALMAQLATSQFDRSKIHEWDKVWAPSEYYNPRLRDATLHDKNFLEVLNESLNKLLLSISNPMSGTVVTTSDITKLQTQVGKAVSEERLTEFYSEPSSEPVELKTNTPDVILSLPDEYHTVNFAVAFKSYDNRIQSFNVLISHNGNTVDQTIYAEVITDDEDMLRIDVNLVAGKLTVNLIASTPGRVTTKILFAS